MRVLVAVPAALLILAGCGGDGSDSGQDAQPRSVTLRSLWKQPGQDVGLVMGTSDYAPGPARVSFLVVARDGRPIFRKRARIWISEGLDAKPFARGTATLEQVGVPGGAHNDHDVTHLYVANVSLPRPMKYWLLAEPVGGPRIQGVGNVVVKKQTAAPPVGARAVSSRTPTLADVGGRAARLTTRRPPDTELLRYSVADSLRARKPFVVVFATPKYCTSRTCGPLVDVVDVVRRRFAGRGDVRFIHVEIYRNNKPQLGVNRFVREWRLPSEPWTFLVGRDGRIKGRFEGSVSVRELSAAVERLLL